MAGVFDGEPNWSLIPEHMHEGIRTYVEQARPPGDFLRALLSNDLQRTLRHADSENLAALGDWLMFVWNYVPSNCWGSPEIVAKWLGE